MTCSNCQHKHAQRVTLIDGRQVCSWCEEWRHECEARNTLNLPQLHQRRAYLYGVPNEKGYSKGGIIKRRGQGEVTRLENTMLAMWSAGQKIGSRLQEAEDDAQTG